jgi:hypothetical protein
VPFSNLEQASPTTAMLATQTTNFPEACAKANFVSGGQHNKACRADLKKIK